MLAQKFRLTAKKDFDLAKKEGKNTQSDSFILSKRFRKDKESSRFGFIVTTGISKNASLRNRAKRSLSEGVRYMLSVTKDGYDVVFIAKPSIVKVYTSDLMREVGDALKKANLVK